ncbi:MAG: lytic transglycosylase domain-containing protein [Anaerovoracaceae bacterium]|jgi:hypothetical protein
MAKRLISVWLSLALLLLFSPTSIYAKDIVKGEFLNRNIDINGVRIHNYYLEDSFFLHQNRTYIPMNKEMGDVLGFAAEMDWESRTLKILKKEPVTKEIPNTTLKNNLRNIEAVALKDIKVVILTEKKREESASLWGVLPDTLRGLPFRSDALDIAGQIEEHFDERGKDWILMPELVSEKLDLSKVPVLKAGDTLYLPLKAFTECSFEWDICYDDYSGVYISTDPLISAAETLDKRESDYNRGLAKFIRSRNGNISEGLALQMVFLFKHEARVHNLDEKLLMAIAFKESTFYPKIVAPGGSVGLMQIMPSTARAHGITKEQLYDMHENIQFGAWYIGQELKRFGDSTKALSAYNQGGGAVSRGNYSTRYAGRVLGGQQEIESYLKQNGHI